MTDLDDLDFLDQSEPEPGSGVFGLSLGSWVLLIGVLATAVVFGLQLSQRNESQPRSGPAPEFSVPLFNSDETFTLSEHRGEIVILNFWASWCGPCRREVPALQAVHEKFRDQGVVIIGVAFADQERDSLEFIEEFGVTYLNAPDVETRISRAYNLLGVPETFIIDQDGRVAEFVIAEVTEARLTNRIEQLLAGVA